MSDDQEQKPKKKKTWHKQWTPRQFAKYLMSIDMKYILPGVSDETVMEEVPNLHCGIGKVSYLRNHREFQNTVEEIFNEKIKSAHSTETMFWLYLKHVYEENMESKTPIPKLLDVLGHLSGKYTPTIRKSKKDKPMTPTQYARLLHQKEQIEQTLKSKTQFDIREKDGEDGN